MDLFFFGWFILFEVLIGCFYFDEIIKYGGL